MGERWMSERWRVKDEWVKDGWMVLTRWMGWMSGVVATFAWRRRECESGLVGV